MGRTKSRRKDTYQILGAISSTQAERLLTDWANVPGTWPLVDDEASYLRTNDALARFVRRYPDIDSDVPSLQIIVLRDFLRKAWDAIDPRNRDWFLFKFRDMYLQVMLRVRAVTSEGEYGPMPLLIPATVAEAQAAIGPRNDPPPITRIEAAVIHLQRSSKALRCPNPTCSAPYFFATKQGQKFCSPECATPSRRESKRRWWHENKIGSKAPTKKKVRNR
jgi:hypothetical protein